MQNLSTTMFITARARLKRGFADANHKTSCNCLILQNMKKAMWRIRYSTIKSSIEHPRYSGAPISLQILLNKNLQRYLNHSFKMSSSIQRWVFSKIFLETVFSFWRFMLWNVSIILLREFCVFRLRWSYTKAPPPFYK